METLSSLAKVKLSDGVAIIFLQTPIMKRDAVVGHIAFDGLKKLDLSAHVQPVAAIEMAGGFKDFLKSPAYGGTMRCIKVPKLPGLVGSFPNSQTMRVRQYSPSKRG